LEEDSCLPTALYNILGDLEDRTGASGLDLSLTQVENICDFRPGMSSVVEGVCSRLNPEIESSKYKAKAETGLGFDKLDSILSNDNSSLPIIELDEDYLTSVDSYEPRPGIDGFNWLPVVIPFKINSDKILLYDPFEGVFAQSANAALPPREADKDMIWEWWSRGERERWTLWLDEEEQLSLGHDF
jgi:hypothetical protein